MRTVSEVTAILRAAGSDPHRCLAALAAAASPALFDALLSSTVLKPAAGYPGVLEPVSGRFQGPHSAGVLRGLIALAPAESAAAARLRAGWTGVVLSGAAASGHTVSARYLDRLTGLKTVHIVEAVWIEDLDALAMHPGLEQLSFLRCTPQRSDLSGLHGARIDPLSWVGQHRALLGGVVLGGLHGAQIRHLDLRSLWGLSQIADWPDGLQTLQIGDAPRLQLTALPPTLTALDLSATGSISTAVLPASLTALSLAGVAVPDLSGMPPLPRLRTLCVTQGATSDLRWLPHGLTALSLSGQVGLCSLEGIEQAAGLTALDLSRCDGLTDLTPVAALSALESINLRGCTQLTDHSPLHALPMLRSIQGDAPTPSAASRRSVGPGQAPAADPRSVSAIRELLDSNNPACTEQAIELVRALCSPELVDTLLAGVSLRPSAQQTRAWQTVAAGQGFSGHRRPALLSLIAQASIGESRILRESITNLKVTAASADVAELVALPGLSGLYLSGVKTLKHPERLAELKTLSTLKLRRSALPEGIEVPRGVRRFNADRLSHWTDLSALSGCRQLERVAIFDTPALRSLCGLSSDALEAVILGRTESLRSVAALADSLSLRRLELSIAQVLPTLAPLTDHPSLSTLTLQNAVTLSSLPDLPSLSDLSLDVAAVTELPALPSLSRLTLQRLPQLRDLGPLSEGLVSASLLQCTRLDTITPLAWCRRLRGLHLVGCPRIGDLSPLAHMAHLKRLTVRDCPQPLDLSPLADCPHLAELDLRGCTQLRGLSTLSGLPQLVLLRLERTGLSKADLPPPLRHIGRWGQ